MKAIALLSLFSSVAFAASPCEEAAKAKKSCPLVKSKPKAPKPIIVVKPVIVPPAALKDNCCEANKGKTETNVSNSNANHFNINVGETSNTQQNPIRYRLIERVRIKTETKTVSVSNPNRFLFLAGFAKTGAVAEVDSCCTATAVSKYQIDLGAMYVRDISSLSVGLAITMRQGFYVAAGFNF